jgi:hypothetical protein
MKTITVVAYNRPKYFVQCLEHLKTCDLTGWDLTISIDGAATQDQEQKTIECLNLANDFVSSGHAARVLHQDKNYGVNWHNKRVMDEAYQRGSDINLHVEDDILLSPDALQLVDWYSKFSTKEEYLFLLLCSKKKKDTEAWNLMVGECKRFMPWGFAYTRKNWEENIETSWMIDPNGWDVTLNEYLVIGQNYKTLQPYLSRINNIGKIGVYCTPRDWAQGFNNHIWNQKETDGNFFFIPRHLESEE